MCNRQMCNELRDGLIVNVVSKILDSEVMCCKYVCMCLYLRVIRLPSCIFQSFPHKIAVELANGSRYLISAG